MSDPLDDTKVFNQTGLEQMMAQKAGAIWAGYLAPWDKIVFAITVGQKYLMENTALGIPALFQTEGMLSSVFLSNRPQRKCLRAPWVHG